MLWIADRHLFGIIQKGITDRRSCGLTGTKIGEMMRVDYSTMSPGKNRLREKRKWDKNLLRTLKELKQICLWSEKDLKEFQENVEDLKKVDKEIWK